MPRPGWDVQSLDQPGPPQLPTDTGVAFMAGDTAIGKLNTPTPITSLTQYEATFGARTGGAALYDAVDVFFREGGSKVYISAYPVTPSLMEADYEVTQAGYEPTGEEHVTAASQYEEQTVADLRAEADSRGLDVPADARKADLVQLLVDNPAPAAAVGPEQQVATPAQIVSAIQAFTAALGPGQVLAPGQTDPVVQNALLQHTIDCNRVALLEAPANQTATQLATYANTYRVHAGARNAAMFAPLGLVPGIATPTARTVGWSTIAAGIIARNDAAGLSPNNPSAGNRGISAFAIDVEKRYTDAEYATLNTSSVNMAQYRWGRLETYGYRTLVDIAQVPQWWDFGNARLEMAINALAGAIAERYVFSQIDGRGHTIAAFGGDLRAMLVPFYENDSLYGSTFEDAAQVNVGPSVNTPTTIANGELHATINVRMSPFAEYVQIYIVKVATTQNIAPLAA